MRAVLTEGTEAPISCFWPWFSVFDTNFPFFNFPLHQHWREFDLGSDDLRNLDSHPRPFISSRNSIWDLSIFENNSRIECKERLCDVLRTFSPPPSRSGIIITSHRLTLARKKEQNVKNNKNKISDTHTASEYVRMEVPLSSLADAERGFFLEAAPNLKLNRKITVKIYRI